MSVFSRKFTAFIVILVSHSLLIAGCTQTRYVSDPAPNRNLVETVAFTTMESRETIVDHAIATLVANNFSITLANDRLGLIQTDYINVLSLQNALADSMEVVKDLANLLMKVSVNAQSSNESVFVQVKGTFQRINGAPKPSDNLIGLYWMEQLTAHIAKQVDAPFAHQLTDSTYFQLVQDAKVATNKKNNTGVRGALKVGGILVAILFAVTLLAGSFGPNGSTVPSS